ncbi:hybrid sensor histidine kinase/response regulator [halophilic archaeon]|nr:hybrid sensor histidine kinase/response regulator [halophilic archaeon]
MVPGSTRNPSDYGPVDVDDVGGAAPIHVLHVDDDPARVRLSETFLDEHIDDVKVSTDTDPYEALERLDDLDVDCIVSDFDMGAMDGLEFLESVRERRPDLPFILFTGKGSEDIASEAISAGVSEYLQKGGGPEKYALLANRIDNVVSQYRAERAAERYQERVNTVYERVTDAFFALDADWQFTFVNEHGRELLDREKGELLGKNVWEEFPAALNSQFEDEYREAMVTQEATTFEAYYPPLDTLFEVHAYPSEEGLSVFFRDATDENRIRRELHREKELLERVLETSPVGIVVADSEGELVRANQRALDLLGLTEEEVKNRTYDSSEWQLTDEEGRPIPDEDYPFSDVFERGVSKTDVRVGYDGPDGEWSLLTVSAAPIHSADGDLERVVFSVEDVTEVRERQQELEAENERLEEFARTVAHELRNPLDIAGVRVDLERRERDAEHLEEAAVALGRMEDIIADLLALAEQGKVVDDPEPVPLERAFENAWSTAGTGAAYELADDLPTVLADESRLRELFENLIGNAVTHAGEDATVRLLPTEDGFAVEDDGPGIPASERERIFETGFSTAEGGSGFGLSIVERIAEAHGWTVDATEADDGGARFEVGDVQFVEE